MGTWGNSPRSGEHAEYNRRKLALSRGAIPLNVAALCMDCDTIFYENGDCPACGSGTWINLARILNRKIRTDSGCWEWQGTISQQTGYGQEPAGKKKVGAHRVIYRLLVGRIPEGMELDHRCRNRRCVNPEHLEAVNHAENVRRGACRRHLTIEKVREIRARRAAGESVRSLANEFGIDHGFASRICTGKKWKESTMETKTPDAGTPGTKGENAK